ncbi:sensor histidine kinase [Streptomyces griseoluteus]|uniref:sensor histidine kinase n=1 Tax=Streptomyces griseoluteus TaxID=29306 RepID=UPI003658116D
MLEKTARRAGTRGLGPGRIRALRERHWRVRSKAERVELTTLGMWHMTPWLLSVSWLLTPLIGGLRHRPLPLALGALLLVVGAAQCAAADRLTRPALDQYLGRAPLPGGALRTPVVLLGTALALIVALTALDGVESWTARLAVGAVLMAFGQPYTLLVPMAVYLRRAGALTVVLVAVLGLARPDDGAGVLGVGLTVAFAVVFALGAGRTGAWTLSVLWEAERAREVQARLAVAEERLRFGRDLHDVLGRNLSVISLKSELAVQLARRGRAEAAAEQMAEVQHIAQESQREVREVVRGYREADLTAELAGARGVLGAAGIECSVRAEDVVLPVPVQSALAWVVREAATNVLRHGDARHCAVELVTGKDHVVLTVENDGAGESAASGGSGLAGLRERLAAVGGTLTAGPAGEGRFRLDARVPMDGVSA